MTTETPPDDWVLLEAGKRGNMPHWGLEQLRTIYKTGCIFTALCDMIQKYEKPPVDRKVLCARAVAAEAYADVAWTDEDIAIRAIELYEEGFGK
jgi:hypothetical protein